MQAKPKGMLGRSWEWITKYSNTFILLVAILGAFGGFPAAARTVTSTWRHFYPIALSDQAILDSAEAWGSTAYLNDGPGASSQSWLVDPGSDISPAISASEGLLIARITSSKEGGYTFILDTAENANLPTGNYFLSMEITGPQDCEYGLTFNVEQTTDRLAWLFIDDTQGIRYGLEVAQANGNLVNAFNETRFYGPVDSIGIVHYGSKYVVELDGIAVRSINSDILTKLDNGLRLSAPGIGVGIYTCSDGSNLQFQFSNLQLQVP